MWLKDSRYEWLELETAPDGENVVGLFCSLCKKQSKLPRNGSATWVNVPCRSVRKDKIDKHINSSMHAAAVSAQMDRVASRVDGGIQQSMRDGVSLQTKVVRGCMELLYWQVKRDIPHSRNYASLLELVEDLGCTYFKALKVGRNATYTSPEIVAEFLQIMASTVKKEILQAVNESESYALMCDESTDISVLKKLVTYVRVCHNGECKTHFLSLADLTDGKAETIMRKLSDVLASCDLSTDKLLSFGSDGASVMVGSRSGVATRFKDINPGVLNVHCIAHRLALATAQAGNQIAYLKKVNDWLAALWKHFHYSPVRAASLREVQQIMQLDELKVVKAADTCWLSHDASVSSLLRILPAVLQVLSIQGASDPTACGLHRQMATYSFIAALHLLHDSLSAVSRLSRAFQSSAVDLSIVQPLVLSTQARIQQLKDKPSVTFQSEVDEIIRKVHSTPFEPTSEDADDDELQHESDQPSHPEVRTGNGEKERFEAIRLQFLQGVLDNITQRFPSIDVIDSFCVLQPENLSSSVTALENLETICQHYHNSPLELDIDALRDEWEQFVEFFPVHAALKEAKTLQDVANGILTRRSVPDLFPAVGKLYSRAATLPVSTADCERAFSTMNRVKTDLRNRLKTTTLERLMFNSLEGPSRDQFDLLLLVSSGPS